MTGIPKECFPIITVYAAPARIELHTVIGLRITAHNELGLTAAHRFHQLGCFLRVLIDRLFRQLHAPAFAARIRALAAKAGKLLHCSGL
jgi:hypothetical protein